MECWWLGCEEGPESFQKVHFQRNVFTKCSSTLARVETQQIGCQLVEENVIQSYSELEENSIFLDTLQVTEGRQYHESGLLHISIQAYIFFVELEKRRVKLLSLHSLKKAWEELVEKAMADFKRRSRIEVKLDTVL